MAMDLYEMGIRKVPSNDPDLVVCSYLHLRAEVSVLRYILAIARTVRETCTTTHSAPDYRPSANSALRTSRDDDKISRIPVYCVGLAYTILVRYSDP